MVIMQFTVIAFAFHLALQSNERTDGNIFNFNESAAKNHNFPLFRHRRGADGWRFSLRPLAASICGWIINDNLQSSADSFRF